MRTMMLAWKLGWGSAVHDEEHLITMQQGLGRRMPTRGPVRATPGRRRLTAAAEGKFPALMLVRSLSGRDSRRVGRFPDDTKCFSRRIGTTLSAHELSAHESSHTLSHLGRARFGPGLGLCDEFDQP